MAPGNEAAAFRNREAGLTLIELIVVLTILAAVSSLIAPSISNLAPGYRLSRIANEMISEIKIARNSAISANKPLGFFIDPENYIYFVQGRPEKTFPEGVALTFTGARILIIDDQIGEIRFFPDGTSTGGRFRLNNGSVEIEIDVDWFNGRVVRKRISLPD